MLFKLHHPTLPKSGREGNFFTRGFLVPNYFCFYLIFLKKLGTKKPLVKKLLLDLIRVALGDEADDVVFCSRSCRAGVRQPCV